MAHSTHARIPATVITGFLGAGKTTLLNRILTESHGLRIAIIENEFGEIGIDNEILVESKEHIVEMNNGCICCSIRGDLVEALKNLAQQRADKKIKYDYVIIETTGLANPAPVCQTFFTDEDVSQHFILDGVVTLVDAKHAMQQLDQHREAQAQIGFADRILLSKTDLVAPEEIATLRHRLLHINRRASVETAHFGETPIGQLLKIQGFNLTAVLEVQPDFLETTTTHEHAHEHHDHTHCEHEHHHGEHCHHPDHHHGHHHDEIQSFVLQSDQLLDREAFEDFMSAMIELYATDMLRYKGIFAFTGHNERFILQGVHMLANGTKGAAWKANEPRHSVMVVIGRNLRKDLFEQEFMRCIAQ